MRSWPLALLTYGIILVGSLSAPAPADAAESFLQKLRPHKKVAADPSADYTLSESQGPWLVLATTFSGPEGEQKARDLVLDLRSNFKLPAYYWGMSFKIGEGNPGRGIDIYGAPIPRRYQRGNQVVEHAVLVGNFPTIDDPEARQLLKRIKTLQPESLNTEGQPVSPDSLIDVRTYRKLLRKSHGKEDDKGPMSHAFLTSNPILPREYFVASSVSEDVVKWNEGFEFSLLRCSGKHSIKVATFRGRSTIKGNLAVGSQGKTRKAKKDDPLVQAGENAHLLTVALREKGWEAYEFHDRSESYVTIGSFDNLQRRPDGQVVPNRDAEIIINTFGATSPNNIFNRPAKQDTMLENRKKQEFLTRFSPGGAGQIAGGFHPKRFVGMPFDIYPKVIDVPHRSISSAYFRN